MGLGSTVTITVGEQDVTSDVLATSARFEAASNATPGTCEFIVRDPEGTHTFTVGAEIVLTVDGVPLWGGYLMQAERTFAAPVDVAPYTTRQWKLRGVDYNILFDKRIIYNASDLLHLIDTGKQLGTAKDGEVIRYVLANYVNLSGFDISSDILDVATLPGSGETAKIEQGWKLRQLFETYSIYSGAVWYIDPAKVVRFTGLENVEHRWGLSDAPNDGVITQNPPQYQGVTIGFRDASFTEDGSQIVNDAFVWGGSEWANGTVVARRTDNTSIATYGRWQYAETRFGDLQIQSAVDARADAIVFGPPGADALGQQKGLRYTQWQAEVTWHAHRVPLLSGSPDHIRPGDLVTFDLTAFNKTLLLPCRNLSITFPSLDEDGNGYVEIRGTFSLQLSDPWTLWRYLRANQPRVEKTILAVVDNSSTSTTYGALGRFVPSPAPDGSTTVFTIPFGYIPGSGTLYLNGLVQRVGIDWLESNPTAGQITLTSAPVSTDSLYFVCRTLES
jgi:hypothetical protein